MTIHLREGAVEPAKSAKYADLDFGFAPRPYARYFKRAAETITVLIALPIAIPLIIICALLAATDGKNPFYIQRRVGKDGRVFKMWKLRTMLPNAHASLESYLNKNAAARLEWDATQKLKNDPRITRIGRFLRKSSLDELPQLFNVLNGTMSLVGPRPIMECQRDLYSGSAYFNMRPGITGLWQVSERNNCEFSERAAYDTKYYRSLSLANDLEILQKTVSVVLRGTGH